MTIIGNFETVEAITRHLRTLFVVTAEVDRPDDAGIRRRLTINIAKKGEE